MYCLNKSKIMPPLQQFENSKEGTQCIICLSFQTEVSKIYTSAKLFLGSLLKLFFFFFFVELTIMILELQ